MNKVRRLGAHMSIAGGVHEAVLRGKRAGCTAIQIFSKNNNQWNAKPLSPEEIAAFRQAVKDTGVEVPLAHAAYLINLASPKPPLWEQSFTAMRLEVERAGQLDIPYLVFHPGSHTGTGAKEGIERIAKAINLIHKQQERKLPMILLECMAGQGSSIGSTFEELSEIINLVLDQSRIGVCIDTCHLFAAGYDIRTPEGHSAVFDAFDRRIGIARIKAFHLNDSKKELGSRVDRHEHIGKGAIGLEAFRALLNDARFSDLPMVLETPKDEADEFDRMNLAALRGVIEKPVPAG